MNIKNTRAMEDIDNGIKRLIEIRESNNIKAYKTMLDVVMTNINMLDYATDFSSIIKYIKFNSIKEKLEAEINNLYDWKESYYYLDDTRDYRHLTHCYKSLTTKYSDIDHILNKSCEHKQTENNYVKKLYDYIDLNDDDVLKDVIIKVDKWELEGNNIYTVVDMIINSYPNRNTETEYNEVIYKDTESENNIKTVSSLFDSNSSLDQLLKLAHENNILLDSRNRGIGKTRALFKLAEKENVFIITDPLQARQNNKEFNTNRFDSIDNHISNLRVPRLILNRACFVDELTVEQVKGLVSIGFNVKTGFINNGLKQIDMQ